MHENCGRTYRRARFVNQAVRGPSGAITIGTSISTATIISASASASTAAGSTDFSVSAPLASARLSRGFRRLTQYSALYALARSASSNDTSTRSGLCERV